MSANPAELKKLLALGTGVGIEIGARDLRVTVARVRPGGAQVLGAATIVDFRERAAAEWGSQTIDFLKRLGAGHLAATVLLPRREVIVRQVALPGVARRDLAAAIQFQIESLHPYAEEDAAWAWTPVGRSGSVLIGIVRRQALERHIALFAEAGLKLAAFTFSAAVLYSALRLLGRPPAGFLTALESDGAVETYGESEARPLFSAAFDQAREKACALARAELRLAPEVEPLPVESLLPKPRLAPRDYDLSRDALAYAAALAGACPRLALAVNLLPVEHRSTASRALYYPTAVLAGLLLLALVVLGSIRPIEDRKYQAALGAAIARLEPQALKASELDRSIDRLRSRTRLLDEFRHRSKADLDALAELTRILEPPAWANLVELTRSSLILTGQAEQAAPLLKLLDSSPLFQGSQFTAQLGRQGKNEVFRIQAAREGGGQ